MNSVLSAAVVITCLLGSPVQALLFHYFDYPIADAMVDSAMPAVNFGADVTLRIQGYAEHPPMYSLGSFSQVFLKFDLSAIPHWAEIVSAELGMYFVRSNPGGASTVDPHASLFLVRDHSWDEMTVTWDSKPSRIGGYVNDEKALTQSGQYYVWDLLSDLGENAWTDYWLDIKDGYLSLMLMVVDEHMNNYALFNSREAHDNWPDLRITYIPEPVSMVLLGVGSLFLRKRRLH